jgi:hypothetical protein
VTHLHQTKNTKRIFAVSDLHIGAPYSGWKRDIGLVKEGIRIADEVVLCGDIFEGTWGLVPLHERISTAKRQLEDMVKVARTYGTKIHLIFGNHEVPLVKGGAPENAPYLEVSKAVLEIVREYPEVIEFHDKGWVQIGDTVFTHGHLQTGFYETVPPLARQLVELPLNIMLPGYAGDRVIFPRDRAHIQLHKAFAEEPQLAGKAISHVVSGHRHAPTPVKGIKPKGDLKLGGEVLNFHDLGAAIWARPALFQPIMMTQDAEGKTTEILGKEHFTGAGHVR